ncbi:putative Rgp1 [Trypanosoma cruzi]|uniref:Putative Rgp1 n=1 Tax=Trypanosoma cruzi TaxID=5693 RepID=A0A2V2VEH6_TRYCR|nr:putative Rgp1 [Trypanosoma cruzi]
MEAGVAGSGAMLLSASLHRRWYAPGDVVRSEVCLHGFSNPSDSVSNGVAMRFGRMDNYFADIDIDAPTVVRVKSLVAQIVGACVVDSRRIQYDLGGGRAMDERCRIVIEDTLSKDHNVYGLFCSDDFSLVSNLPLRERESRALVVKFTLPQYLPSSFRGQCIRFYYALFLHGVYCDPRNSNAPVKLRIPIQVFSAQAIVTPLLLPVSFPLERFDFQEKVSFLQSAPSSALTGPLQSHLVPSEVEEFHAHVLSKKALNTQASQLSKQRTPLQFPLSLDGELALTVVVASTTVMIGESLSGIFVVQDNPKFQPVKILGSLEFLECCSSKHVKKGISRHQLPGWRKELVVAQTRVMEELDWVVLDRATVPFSVPFTNPNTYASMHTDVVTLCWQLRLRILWCRLSELRQCRASCREELRIEKEEPEVVVPLIVVPPSQSEQHPCRGATLQVLC